MAALPEPYITPEQYIEIERKAEFKSEYIAGQMFAMADGSPEHSLIAVNITGELRLALKGGGCRVYNSDLNVWLAETNMFAYPDVTVVCGDVVYGPARQAISNPLIIVEVLSPSTESYDRGAKAAHYRRSETLREYVFVSQSEPAIERFTRDTEGKWYVTDARGIDAVMELTAVSTTLKLSEVYANIEFKSKKPELVSTSE